MHHLSNKKIDGIEKKTVWVFFTTCGQEKKADPDTCHLAPPDCGRKGNPLNPCAWNPPQRFRQRHTSSQPACDRPLSMALLLVATDIECLLARGWPQPSFGVVGDKKPIRTSQVTNKQGLGNRRNQFRILCCHTCPILQGIGSKLFGECTRGEQIPVRPTRRLRKWIITLLAGYWQKYIQPNLRVQGKNQTPNKAR